MTEDEQIKEESLKIHEQRILDSKIQQAANDLWTVELLVNQKLEKWSILQEQLKDAAREKNSADEARKRFLQHRNLEQFKKEVKDSE